MRCSPLLHPSPQVLTEDQHPHPPPWRRATRSSGPQARTPVEDTRSCRTGTPETQSSREPTSSAHFLPSLPDRWGPHALGRGPAQTTTCRKGLALSSGFRADLTLLPRHSLLCQALPRKQLLWPKPRTHRGLSGKQSQNPGPPWRGAESRTLAPPGGGQSHAPWPESGMRLHGRSGAGCLLLRNLSVGTPSSWAEGSAAGRLLGGGRTRGGLAGRLLAEAPEVTPFAPSWPFPEHQEEP